MYINLIVLSLVMHLKLKRQILETWYMAKLRPYFFLFTTWLPHVKLLATVEGPVSVDRG